MKSEFECDYILSEGKVLKRYQWYLVALDTIGTRIIRIIDYCYFLCSNDTI